MFDLDKWQEIWFTIRKNKLRTFITAFGIAWGIFIFVILIGFGSAFQNGIRAQFDIAKNAMFVGSGETSIPYRGIKPGRQIQLTNSDIELIRREIPLIDHYSGRYYFWGDNLVKYQDQTSYFVVLGCHADLMVIRAYELAKGRFLDPLDIKEKRRVAVIGQRVKDVLFGNVDPIGKEIQITGSTYTVIGMLKDRDNRWENKRIIIPLSTAQVAYGKGNDIQSMMFTVNTSSVPATLMAEQTIRNVMAEKHRFSPDDEKALRVENVLEEYNRWMAVFGGIKIFLGVVGVFTLLAGIVGISNIMLIIAQERTREIGVRKALGATPRSIVGLFLMEAMIITIVSGYLGLLGGALFVTKGGLLKMMLNFGFPEDFFGDPSIDLIIVLSATAILIAAGSLAGYFPARRASLIQPVEALKDE